MADRPRLIIRADGGPGIGSGHLARCLALAQAWIDRGGDVTLATDSAPGWDEQYRAEGVTVVSADLGALELAGTWVVLDGYQFGVREQATVRAAGARLLVVDDHGTAGRYLADLVLDQNLAASSALYADRDPETEVLLGTTYALLRREFRPFSSWERQIRPTARRLLVSLGGSPPAPALELARLTLEQPELAAFDAVWLEGTTDVAAEMSRADVALSASGSICWELCFMGLPAVLLSTAPNQVPLAAALAARGVAVDAGGLAGAEPGRLAGMLRQLAGDHQRRSEMARRGRALVDGRGAARVVTRMRSSMIGLRPATPADARLLWDWANEPGVREASFSSDPIPWDGHRTWLAAKLSDPTVRLYIGTGPDGKPLGQVRFEEAAGEAEIHVSVDRHWRRSGWGAALVDAGVRRLLRETAVDSVRARIKTTNRASATAFENAGFQAAEHQPAGLLEYVRRRPREAPGHG